MFCCVSRQLCRHLGWFSKSLLVSGVLVSSLLATHHTVAQDGVVKSPEAKRGLGVTPGDRFSVAAGFKVELVHEVAAETEGSWVSLTTDPKGRLLACDQNGGLFRIDVSSDEAKVEKLAIDVQGAQGLLFAFNSLYANLNTNKQPSGIWRLTDTDGDDQFDKKEHLVEMNAAGEHGPHAMILTPDGKRILFCAGNNTVLPANIERSRVPKVWSEDHLLGRMPDARGHNADRLAPGGFVASMNPDGSEIELVATGFRNEYDIALNQDNELFAYDADMEWDVGTPWYRPTRVNHVISGAEFGWRNGTGKWPAYYPDSFGAAVDIGPGSPTGITFGYGTNYPKKYQDALFLCDWSYGNIYAVHLTPEGSSYGGTYETFATAAPLPVTDIVVRQEDGLLYFTTGGRGTQSGLYRVRYTGEADAAVATKADDSEPAKLRKLRHELESMHLAQSSEAVVDVALKNLGSDDRAIAFAARIALEHQPVDSWRSRIASLDSAQAKTLAVIALARHGNESDRAAAMENLNSLDWSKLSPQGRIDLLRGYGLVSIRLGKPTTDEAGALATRLVGEFPTKDNRVNRELAQWLVYLQSPDATGKVLDELTSAASQEDQLFYAMTLRGATKGWNPERRKAYLSWFNEIQSARGGMSFGGFIENIKKEHVGLLNEKTQQRFADLIHPPKSEVETRQDAQRPFVKEWTVNELVNVVSDESNKPNFERGREMFGAAQCYKCHRMGIQGGILGPELTSAGGKFNPHDLLVSIIEPSKVISDQYAATQFLTEDGKVVIGRVVNMAGNQLRVMTNMLDPSSLVDVDRTKIEETAPTNLSMMPMGLIDTLDKEEIVDLVAYLRAGGNPLSPIYTGANAAQTQDSAAAAHADDQSWISYPGGDGIGSGKHIVLVSGDEEYRSEEGLPQLAKMFSTHFGFQTTVLFAIDPKTGEINPDVLDNIPNLQAVDSADLLIIATRMRKLPDDQMKHLVDYIEAGKPIVALRTATHAFNSWDGSSYNKYGFQNKGDDYEGGFGRQVLGETWISHHGKHKSEATRGIVADKDHPIVRGIKPGDIFGPTDVYGVRLPLPGDSHPIVLGAILTGMNPDDEVVTDKRIDPMMPIAWTKTYKGGRTFTTTMGAATDLPSEGVRRMIVNGALWTMKMDDEIKPDLDVSIVGEFNPTAYGFGGYIKGKKPADYR